MVKLPYVYHGTARELEGDNLIPKRAKDLNDNPDNLLEGVYASQSKDVAICMGILSCKGVKISSLNFKNGKVNAVIYEGWPEQDHFYVYTLPLETFENIPKGSHQYVSLVPVEPQKVEILLVKNYIHLIRRATNIERIEWSEKFADKLNK